MQGGDAVEQVPHGDLLIDLVEAVHGGSDADLAAARQAVRETLGDAAFVDACATIASFNAVVKLADGCGIPLEDFKITATEDIRAELAIEALKS